MLSRGQQNMCRRLWLTRFLKTLLKSKYLVCSADENLTGYHLALGHLFRGIFFETARKT